MFYKPNPGINCGRPLMLRLSYLNSQFTGSGVLSVDLSVNPTWCGGISFTYFVQSLLFKRQRQLRLRRGRLRFCPQVKRCVTPNHLDPILKADVKREGPDTPACILPPLHKHSNASALPTLYNPNRKKKKKPLSQVEEPPVYIRHHVITTERGLQCINRDTELISCVCSVPIVLYLHCQIRNQR